MSEDQRVARSSGEPDKHGRPGAARWADYLSWLRDEFIDRILAMPVEEQRRSLVPSEWTPLELLSHVVHMEQRWFVWGFLGEAVDEPWGDWNVADPTASNGRWRVPAEVTAEQLAELLRDVGERTATILREHSLGDVANTGGRFGSDPPTLEWICFHVLAEYARHAGQLDIVIELGSRR